MEPKKLPVGRRIVAKVLSIKIEPNVCHNGYCREPRSESVLGPYCSWRCRNEDKFSY